MASIRHISNPRVLDRSVWVGNCSDEVFSGGVDPADIQRAAALWDNLDPDPYLRDGGSYRQRRYAEMSYDARGDTLVHLAKTDFYQSNLYNQVNGGTRKFTLIEESFLEGRLLRPILRHFSKRFAAALGACRLELFLHQVRIFAEPGSSGLPTPEGIHKDGVDFSCQVLFGRQNVRGGESIIYDNDRNPLLGTTMLNPLDFYCFSDREIYHSVTPVESLDGSTRATRDILGIEFCVRRERAGEEA